MNRKGQVEATKQVNKPTNLRTGEQMQPVSEKKSRWWLWLIIVIVVVIILLGIYYWLF